VPIGSHRVSYANLLNVANADQYFITSVIGEQLRSLPELDQLWECFYRSATDPAHDTEFSFDKVMNQILEISWRKV
jgi:hypothetical protein